MKTCQYFHEFEVREPSELLLAHATCVGCKWQLIFFFFPPFLFFRGVGGLAILLSTYEYAWVTSLDQVLFTFSQNCDVMDIFQYPDLKSVYQNQLKIYFPFLLPVSF